MSEHGWRRLRRAELLTSNIEHLTPNEGQPTQHVLHFKSLVLDVRCQTFSPAQRPSACVVPPAIFDAIALPRRVAAIADPDMDAY